MTLAQPDFLRRRGSRLAEFRGRIARADELATRHAHGLPGNLAELVQGDAHDRPVDLDRQNAVEVNDRHSNAFDHWRLCSAQPHKAPQGLLGAKYPKSTPKSHQSYLTEP